MRLLSSITILTLVMFSLGSPDRAFGAKCTDKESAKELAQKEFDALKETTGDKDKTAEFKAKYNAAKSALESATTALKNCESDNTEMKESCKKWETDRKDIITKFDSSSQAMAALCAETDLDSEPQYTKAALYAMVGQTFEGKEGCELGGAKTRNKDKRESIDKDIEKLESANRKADADIIKKTERVQDELTKINEDRRRMKEEYENAQEDAESAQVKALAQLRDKQLQLADNIRKLQTASITARQNVQSVEIELKAAMTTAKASNGKIVNLRSESAINLHCVAVAKAANKENFGSGTSKNASSGASRVAALKEAYKNCVDELHDMRNNMSQSFANALEHRVNQQNEIAEQIESANKQYAQLTEDYNKMLETLKGKLTKAQQRYYEKDNELANKYNQALQRGQQEQNQLQMQKMQDQQKMIAKYNSQGDLSKQDIDEIVESSNELKDVETKLSENECPGHKKGEKTTADRVREAVEKKKDAQQ